MSSVEVVPLCFYVVSQQSTQPSTSEFWGTSCLPLLTSLMERCRHTDLAPAQSAKGNKSCGVTVLSAGKLTWPEPHRENLWANVKGTMQNTRPNNSDDLKAAINATCASITPEQYHRLIMSIPCHVHIGCIEINILYYPDCKPLLCSHALNTAA